MGSELKDRIEELEEKIEYHRKKYYNGKAEISDAEYDALEDELRELAPKHPLLSKTGASPEKSGWEKFQHSFPMHSLNKVNGPSEFEDWVRDVFSEAGVRPSLDGEELLYWSEKLDGISIALYYEDGSLERAVTRGDGKVGEDLIANVVLMRGIQRELSRNLTGAVRGEIVLPFHFYEEHLSHYSNPRNAASGIARLENRSEAKKCQYLSIYAYDCQFDGPSLETEFEKFHFLDNLGFQVPNHGGPYEASDIAELYEKYEEDLRGSLNYDIDGLVITLNDKENYRKAGKKGGNPHGSVALKFASETALTTVKDVKWQIGNTRRITPVAVFESVELFGAEIKKASLYNCSEIERLNLNIGDQILVERANDVIPKIIEVTEKRNNEGTVDIPDSCPKCGNSNLEWEGEYLLCNSSECTAQLVGELKAWIDALGILDWGSFILEKVVEEGFVKSIPDLYELEKEELASLRDKGGKKVGMKVATKLVEKLHSNKEMLLEDFLGGLRIPMCRQKTFQMLIEEGYSSLEAVQSLSKGELEKVKGIGPKKAKKLYEGLQEKKEVIEELLNYIEIKSASGGLEGKNICITGSLSKTRSEVKQDIKEAGGTYKGMSKKVDYLVAADSNSGSSKIEKSEEYDIPVITEEELYKMILSS